MSADQLELLIRTTVGTEVRHVMLLAVVVSALVAILASFLAGYLQAKGTHRALREDLQTLTAQVQATTKAAEEIRAQIGQSTWMSQRRWDLKRELYTELMKALYLIVHIDTTAWNYYMSEQRSGSDDHAKLLAKKSDELFEQRKSHMEDLIRVRGIGELMFSRETIAALDELKAAWGEAADTTDYWSFLDGRLAASKKGHEKVVLTAKQDMAL